LWICFGISIAILIVLVGYLVYDNYMHETIEIRTRRKR
jgi:uncharacterized protein (TIGR02588 family)